MKRSTILVIAIVFVSIIGGGLLGFYFYLNSASVDRDQFGDPSINTGSGFGSANINTSIILPGNASTTQSEQTPEISRTLNTGPEKTIPTLRQIYQYPVAGTAFFTEDIIATTSAIIETVVFANGTTSTSTTKIVKPAQSKSIGKKEMLHFVDRGNGHIFKTSSSTLELEKISNYTVPKVYEAYFINQTNYIFRGLYQETDIIQTRFNTLKLGTPTSSEKILVTKDLSANLAQIAISPNNQRTFYIQNNRPTGIITNPDGTNSVTAFNSAFTEWNISWPSDKVITLTTKPSAFVKGYSYVLNPTSLAVEKTIGDILGLTINMSPDGETLVYTESSAGSPNLFSFNRKTGQISNLFFRTFSDKCTWSKKEATTIYCAVPQDIAYGDYPDAWYQGLIFFSDDVWKINTKTGETRLIAKLNTLSDTSIDVINPTLSLNEDFLVFNNKKDLSLWGLRLPGKPVVSTSTIPIQNSTTTPKGTLIQN